MVDLDFGPMDMYIYISFGGLAYDSKILLAGKSVRAFMRCECLKIMNDMDNINRKVLETLSVLRNTPLMVITKDDSYDLLQNYIEGYIDGLSHALNKNIRLEVTNWYKKIINSDTSYYWTSHIPIHFRGKSDAELKEILLNVTEAYFKNLAPPGF